MAHLLVDHGSPAYRAGLRSGWELETVNGEKLLDFIDYEYFCAQNELWVRANGKDFHLVKEDEEDWGFVPDTELYPAERRCANHCVFCFEDQLPAGMRDSLHAKDDDWRYSLLFGNYVTMTNMGEADFSRLIARHVSPLFISVHTTNPELRVKMMANPRAGLIMEQLRRLADAGISFHCQIVLCPGWNDGEELERTLRDLASLRPAACSAAVVPLGMTVHRQGLVALNPVTRKAALDAVHRLEAFADRCEAETGERFAFGADELYQLAGLPWPRYEAGGHSPQLSNGVGIMHELISEFEEALEDAPASLNKPRRITLATGHAAAPTMARLLARLESKVANFSARVVEIRNDFFGETITVAGLLVGSDLARQLEGRELGDALLIPGSTLKAGTELFLDDWTLTQLQDTLQVPICPVPDDGYELLALALGLESI